MPEAKLTELKVLVERDGQTYAMPVAELLRLLRTALASPARVEEREAAR